MDPCALHSPSLDQIIFKSRVEIIPNCVNFLAWIRGRRRWSKRGGCPTPLIAGVLLLLFYCGYSLVGPLESFGWWRYGPFSFNLCALILSCLEKAQFQSKSWYCSGVFDGSSRFVDGLRGSGATMGVSVDPPKWAHCLSFSSFCTYKQIHDIYKWNHVICTKITTTLLISFQQKYFVDGFHYINLWRNYLQLAVPFQSI